MMRLSVAAAIAALAASCSADRMEAVVSCSGEICKKWGTFTTDHASWRMDPSDGCRATDVPFMEGICIDWFQQRAHLASRTRGGGA